MFNIIQLSDIEKMGAGIILKNKIKNTFKGTLYNGVLLGPNYEYEVKVIYYWLGGGTIVSILGDTKDEITEKENAIEDEFEQAMLSNKNGIRTMVYKRILLKGLCFVTRLVSFIFLMLKIINTEHIYFMDNNMTEILIYATVLITSKYISLKANAM